MFLEYRKKLLDDVCSIVWLHTFLEHWSLINFNVDINNYLKTSKIHLGTSGGTVSGPLINISSQYYLKQSEKSV